MEINEHHRSKERRQRHDTRVSYCMVCAYVREGNPRALASGLSPVHTHNHTITALLHQHDAWALVHYEIFDVEHWNITQRCNNVHKGIFWIYINSTNSNAFFHSSIGTVYFCVNG